MEMNLIDSDVTIVWQHIKKKEFASKMEICDQLEPTN